MWIRTVSGWVFFEVKHTKQGIPYPIEPTKGKTNF